MIIIPAAHSCRIPLPIANQALAQVRHGLKVPPAFVQIMVAFNGTFHRVDNEKYLLGVDDRFITVNTKLAVAEGGNMVIVEFSDREG